MGEESTEYAGDVAIEGGSNSGRVTCGNACDDCGGGGFAVCDGSRDSRFGVRGRGLGGGERGGWLGAGRRD